MAKILQFPTVTNEENVPSDAAVELISNLSMFLSKPSVNKYKDGWEEGRHTTGTGAKYFVRKGENHNRPQIHLAKITDEILHRILKTKRYIKTDEEKAFLMRAVELYESGVWIDDGGDNRSCGKIEVLGNYYFYFMHQSGTGGPGSYYRSNAALVILREHLSGNIVSCTWPVHELYAKTSLIEDRTEAVTLAILSCCYDTVRLQDNIEYLPLDKEGNKPRISGAAKQVTRERKKFLKEKQKADALKLEAAKQSSTEYSKTE
jgi:hypothetical protein